MFQHQAISEIGSQFLPKIADEWDMPGFKWAQLGCITKQGHQGCRYGLYHVVSMFCVTCRGWNFDLRKEIQQDRWHERMKVVASCWLCPKSEFTRHNYPYCIEIAISMECLCLAAHRVIFVLAILTVSLDGKLKPCRMAVSKPTKVAAAPECSVSWSSNFMLKPSREWRLPSGNLTYK